MLVSRYAHLLGKYVDQQAEREKHTASRNDQHHVLHGLGADLRQGLGENDSEESQRAVQGACDHSLDAVLAHEPARKVLHSLLRARHKGRVADTRPHLARRKGDDKQHTDDHRDAARAALDVQVGHDEYRGEYDHHSTCGNAECERREQRLVRLDLGLEERRQAGRKVLGS